MWNNTDVPLAYLITFRCYGTWLHGDDWGAIDRFHNQYKSPYLPSNEGWRKHNLQILECEPVTLSDVQRESVERAIRETCSLRNWLWRAINVRTNHVHAVVSLGITPPERALDAFKAKATRQLRQEGCWRHLHSPGRTRAVNDSCGMIAALSVRLILLSTAKVMHWQSLTEQESRPARYRRRY